MIKISISLLLDAIEDNINDEELQSIDFESHIRKITKEFQGENGEFLVKKMRLKRYLWTEIQRIKSLSK